MTLRVRIRPDVFARGPGARAGAFRAWLTWGPRGMAGDDWTPLLRGEWVEREATERQHRAARNAVRLAGVELAVVPVVGPR